MMTSFASFAEAHAAITELESALHDVYHSITGNWPLPTMTPRDLANEIIRRYQRAIDPPRRDVDDGRLGEELL